MSGGSYEYLCYKVEEFADQMELSSMAERRAFGGLLRKVSHAMHDIEWVDSGDMGNGDEIKAINNALGKASKTLILDELLKEARVIYKKLGTFTKKGADDDTNNN